MPPSPSDPARIPMTRKKMRVGMPKRFNALPASTLINNSIDPTNKLFPVSVNMRCLSSETSYFKSGRKGRLVSYRDGEYHGEKISGKDLKLQWKTSRGFTLSIIPP